MLYQPKRNFTDAIVWNEYDPDIEVAEKLLTTLKGFVRASGVPPEILAFERHIFPLESDNYIYAGVKSYSGRSYELAWNGHEYIFYSASDVGEDEGWCFKVPGNKANEIKVSCLRELCGEEFLNIFANLLEN